MFGDQSRQCGQIRMDSVDFFAFNSQRVKRASITSCKTYSA